MLLYWTICHPYLPKLMFQIRYLQGGGTRTGVIRRRVLRGCSNTTQHATSGPEFCSWHRARHSARIHFKQTQITKWCGSIKTAKSLCWAFSGIYAFKLKTFYQEINAEEATEEAHRMNRSQTGTTCRAEYYQNPSPFICITQNSNSV